MSVVLRYLGARSKNGTDVFLPKDSISKKKKIIFKKLKNLNVLQFFENVVRDQSIFLFKNGLKILMERSSVMKCDKKVPFILLYNTKFITVKLVA